MKRDDLCFPDSVREICLLAPTLKLAETAQRIIDERGDPIDVFYSQPGEKSVQKNTIALVERGARVFISRKGMVSIMKSCSGIPVVGINNTSTDYLSMLLNIPKTEKLIGIMTFGALDPDTQRMCQIMNYNVKNYVFDSFESCQKCVEQAKKDGVVYVIGGAWSIGFAAELGMKHYTIENSRESIISAFDNAGQVYEVYKEDLEKRRALRMQVETYEAVLKFTHDAIVAVNDGGKVIVMNPVAEQIVGVLSEDAVGKHITDIIPNTKMPEVLHAGRAQVNQIMTINKTLANTNRIPIVIDGDIRGVVATFQDIKQLQSSEQKIRIKLHEKGLTAKHNFSHIMGESQAIRAAVQIADSYARSDASVLIHGETGVGKELFAQSIHNASGRKNGPFVALNCSAVADNLLESELFGYEEGAFTGAVKGGRPGLFEVAHGGTIFLDEIGEIPTATQVALLRVLQEKEVRRVGGNKVIPVDVRVIAATNRDLIAEINDERFREDLYYRLNVLDLEIPPLREREGDVKILGSYFLRCKLERNDETLAEKYLQLLAQVEAYPWYGNVRELENFTERLYIMLKNENEKFSVLTEMMRRRSDMMEKTKPAESDPEAYERTRILAILKTVTSMEEAAKLLGYSRQTLWRKMKKLNITKNTTR